jgi:hypothetical protein
MTWAAILSWDALTAASTFVAAIGAWRYVVLTRRLWEAADRQAKTAETQREAGLMLQLINEYDALRDSLRSLREFRKSAKRQSLDWLEEFRRAARQGFPGDMEIVDDSRFRISRFFNRARRLVEAGYLNEQLIVASLERAALKRFLEDVDPLDQVLAGKDYNPTDRLFFEALKEKYPSKPDTPVAEEGSVA